MKKLDIDSPNRADSVMMSMFTPYVKKPVQSVAPPATVNHW